MSNKIFTESIVNSIVNQTDYTLEDHKYEDFHPKNNVASSINKNSSKLNKYIDLNDPNITFTDILDTEENLLNSKCKYSSSSIEKLKKQNNILQKENFKLRSDIPMVSSK